MRLIDADALIEKYDLKDATKYGNKDAKQQRHSYDTMMMYEIADMIEDAPTAYDAEKVIEQLEKLTSQAGKDAQYYFDNSSNYPCEYNLADLQEKRHNTLREALKIVKSGSENIKGD